MTYRASNARDFDWTFRGWIRWRWGLKRLAQGFCPLCNSSPPDPKCLVCQGSYDYGYRLSAELRKDWKFWWFVHCRQYNRKKLGLFE